MQRVDRVEINEEICIGCGICVKACPSDVLRLDLDRKKAISPYPQECEWCLICEEQCPSDAIRVYPKIPTPVYDHIAGMKGGHRLP